MQIIAESPASVASSVHLGSKINLLVNTDPEEIERRAVEQKMKQDMLRGAEEQK